MTVLETYSGSAAGLAAMQQYAATLRQTPPSAKRAALLRRMDSSLHTSNFIFDLGSGIASRMDSEFGGFGAPPSEADLQSLREQQMPQLRQATLVQSLFTYHTVADDELDRYVTLCETRPFQWFNDTLQSVIEVVFLRQLGQTAVDLRRSWR
jgi:hypothetical protein